MKRIKLFFKIFLLGSAGCNERSKDPPLGYHNNMLFRVNSLIIIIFLYFILVSCSQHDPLNPVGSDQQESKQKSNTQGEESTTTTNSQGDSLTISKLEANPASVAMGGNVTLAVIVSYSGQSQLSYKWEQSGSFAGIFDPETGANVIWTAPVGAPCCVPGPYPITVTIDDDKGIKGSKTIFIQVTL